MRGRRPAPHGQHGSASWPAGGPGSSVDAVGPGRGHVRWRRPGGATRCGGGVGPGRRRDSLCVRRCSGAPPSGGRRLAAACRRRRRALGASPRNAARAPRAPRASRAASHRSRRLRARAPASGDPIRDPATPSASSRRPATRGAARCQRPQHRASTGATPQLREVLVVRRAGPKHRRRLDDSPPVRPARGQVRSLAPSRRYSAGRGATSPTSARAASRAWSGFPGLRRPRSGARAATVHARREPAQVHRRRGQVGPDHRHPRGVMSGGEPSASTLSTRGRSGRRVRPATTRSRRSLARAVHPQSAEELREPRQGPSSAHSERRVRGPSTGAPRPY